MEIKFTPSRKKWLPIRSQWAAGRERFPNRPPPINAPSRIISPLPLNCKVGAIGPQPPQGSRSHLPPLLWLENYKKAFKFNSSKTKVLNAHFLKVGSQKSKPHGTHKKKKKSLNHMGVFGMLSQKYIIYVVVPLEILAYASI